MTEFKTEADSLHHIVDLDNVRDIQNFTVQPIGNIIDFKSESLITDTSVVICAKKEQNKKDSSKKLKKIVKCAIPNCESKEAEFGFPKDPTIRKIWKDLCEKYEVSNAALSRYRVCENHFSSNDIIRDLKGELLGLPIKRKLKPGGK